MKTVERILISLAGALALVGAAVVGCSTTNDLNNGGGTSSLGETCTRSFDCKSGLICQQNVCLTASTTVTGDGGTVDSGDSGTTPPGPHLGLLNESCQTSSDCQSPFECIGQSCTVVSWGLTATGNTCQECKKASDCCELPVGVALTPGLYLQPWYALTDGGDLLHGSNGVTGNAASVLVAENIRCQDLLAFIGGDATICAGSANFTMYENGLASACFLYGAYCGSCATTPPWACNSGECSYTAPCLATGTSAAMLASACPTASRARSGSGFSGTCGSPDGGVGGTCTAGCALDSDCAGKIPLDGNHACALGDAGGSNCSCFQSTCFFTCATDLDCAAGKACDTATTHLCKTQACAVDADCVQSLKDPHGKCILPGGTCTVSCTKDTDCGPPTTICSAGACMAPGCTSDLNCTTGSVHTFCVKAPAATATFSSAVTN